MYDEQAAVVLREAYDDEALPRHVGPVGPFVCLSRGERQGKEIEEREPQGSKENQGNSGEKQKINQKCEEDGQNIVIVIHYQIQ